MGDRFDLDEGRLYTAANQYVSAASSYDEMVKELEKICNLAGEGWDDDAGNQWRESSGQVIKDAKAVSENLNNNSKFFADLAEKSSETQQQVTNSISQIN